MLKSGRRQRWLRLGIPLLLAWSVAWLTGITVLARVAIDLHAELQESNLDGELALYATAVYGLTWFDEHGAFHDEVLRLESELLSAPYDIRVVEPGDPPVWHFASAHPRFHVPDFSVLEPEVMGLGQDVYRDGQDADGRPYRLHAIPTFMDQGDVRKPKAMIVILADPVPTQMQQAFVQRIIRTSVLLGVSGLLLGAVLSWWSLRPAFLSLRQRERFIAATAHELRTPLAALRGISESALQGDEPAPQALGRINTLLQHASHTVEDLLLFARMDAGVELQKQAVRLDLLVETLLPEDGSIPFQADTSIVELDPRLVSVAVRNLLENARKHGVGNGVIGITVCVTGSRVSVADNGSGFPLAVLARQGKDFKLSPSSGGSGLGLAIANLVMRLHGGELRLENTPTHGAKATLIFLA